MVMENSFFSHTFFNVQKTNSDIRACSWWFVIKGKVNFLGGVIISLITEPDEIVWIRRRATVVVVV